jgi:hypothetical protein
MAAVQIPNPPPTPNGDAWVELYRGEDHIFYESADGEASVDLSLKSDGKRRFLEWGVVHWVVGLSRLKIREAWESGRPAEPPMSYHENGHEVVVHLPPSPALEPDATPPPVVSSEPPLSRRGREPEPVTMPRDPHSTWSQKRTAPAHLVVGVQGQAVRGEPWTSAI